MSMDTVYILFLNPIGDRAEILRPVARSSSREALVALVERERDPHTTSGNEWTVHQFLHAFREEGPLGWMNDCGEIRVHRSAESVRRDADAYARDLAAIPEVS